jgi:membrane-associated protease RseP (regulator of RpoE activity)
VRWENLQEIDRQEMSIDGQPAAWVIFDGTGSDGKPVRIRVLGMQGGGVTVGVVISGERSVYNAERGTIEAVLVTLRLGTNPPSAYRTYATVQPDTAAAGGAAASSRPTPGQPSLGLRVRDITDADPQQVDPNGDNGILVDQVQSGSPADQAGIRRGDVILELDRTGVDAAADFQRLLSRHRAGDTVELLIERNGRKRPVSVRVE